jgi:hypothetical protein
LGYKKICFFKDFTTTLYLMKFWFAISHKLPDKRKLAITKESFWCLPSFATKGDLVFLYCPRASSPKHQGVYALCEIEEKPIENHDKKYVCTPYLYKREKLFYTPLRVLEIYAHHLKPKQIKNSHAFSQSQLIKRNFQATLFEITKKQSDELVAKIALLQ